MKKTNISVLITNYNHAHFLPEYLESIFNQTAFPLEVLVIDDASTDNSIELLTRLQQKYQELVIIKNTKNQGPAKAMNSLIRHANGKYLILGAADDKLLPGFLEMGFAYFENNPDVGICCSATSMFKDEKPDFCWKASISREEKIKRISKDAITKELLHTPLWIPTNASLYRRDLVLKYGCLDERLKHLCDWYLNYRIALNHGILYVPHSFGALRILPTSYSAQWNRSYRKKIALYKQLFMILGTESQNFQKAFRQSGVIGLVTSDIFFYLLTHVNLWKYIPNAFYRKTRNFLRKVLGNVFKNLSQQGGFVRIFRSF